MNNRLALVLVVSAAALAACGGGSSSGPSAPPPVVTVAPTVAPQGNLPLSEAVGGSPAWVDPSSHRTLYFLTSDTATGTACVAGCLAIWPPFVPVSGSQNTDNMTIVTRADGTGTQWAYQGHPLYHYTGDTGSDQVNGEGIVEPDGGTWHVSRTVQSAPTPPPGGGTPPPCHGYC